MPFVPDSRTAGYLGPDSSPAPLSEEAYTNFWHDVVAGVTGLDNALVRPRWQLEPPAAPARTVDWAAIGITNIVGDWQPAIIHSDAGDGYDAFQRHEENTLLCSFYGPNAYTFAGLLRDGLFIDQNRAALRAAGIGLVEVTGFTRNADLVAGQFRDRVDTSVIHRRAVRRDYPVLSLVRAQVAITANPPFDSQRTIEDDVDTGTVP